LRHHYETGYGLNRTGAKSAEDMGIIKEELLVKGEKKQDRLTVLFDSGSARSLIKSEVAEEFTSRLALPAPISVTVADGHKVDCRLYCNLVIDIQGRAIVIQPLLVDELPVPLIFGGLEMEAYRIKLDMTNRRLDLSEFTGAILAI
jgi:hypothetical protein